ncbi:N-acetylglucosamine-6-phosphate deacetylase [Methylobrevis albus]|uniref:N-acetylglucosamine-6-phosphate deacetylase n=1 Tax=Methylobrevis albus TaxID=2793297 RepID=A0A931N153_9HYPH|nr:N-acetylglucosamine-6-phosphate deacetylase [Methylobrevis albus]MBH0239471.1 N-acetylglucosamine-6-phosphate deacetylase [Methylobrevis albus]
MPHDALVGARIFDGDTIRDRSAVLIDGGRIAAIVPADAVPDDARRTDLGGGWLAPGFVDAQVNGGGGVLFNDDPSPEGIAAIAAAHRRFGTTALLPTLITDGPAVMAAAIAAVAVGSVPGVIGLHLEGPHLAPARKGAHLAELMRPLGDDDVEALIAAQARVGLLMLTLAPEQAPPALIRRLADAGIVVSLGHSDASYDDAVAAFAAGARCATHLFNAMSPLGHRAPGLVGAALDAGDVWCGVIADGHHVHPASLAVAIRGKRGPGRCFLVTDAMSTVGADGDSFVLNGRTARREDGRLVLGDGTLAGADLDMASAVRFCTERLGVDVEEVLRMASRYPAEALGIGDRFGRIAAGRAADLVHLDDGLHVQATWIGGVRDGEAAPA